MNSIKIEKGVPLPARGKANGMTDALRQMAIGDSFVVPLKSRGSALAIAQRLAVKVASRQEGKQNVRVWRTA